MKARLKHVGLQADLAIGRDNAALRHTAPEISAFFDADLFCSDVYQKARYDIPNDAESDEDQDTKYDQSSYVIH
jgi:hypothetical protein